MDENTERKSVGVADWLIGAPGFTMAVFRADDVPPGTNLYAGIVSPAAELTDAIERANARLIAHPEPVAFARSLLAREVQPTCQDCGQKTAPDLVHTCSPQARETQPAAVLEVLAQKARASAMSLRFDRDCPKCSAVFADCETKAAADLLDELAARLAALPSVQPESKGAERMTVAQIEKGWQDIIQSQYQKLEGTETNQTGWHRRNGWNDALRHIARIFNALSAAPAAPQGEQP